MNYIKEKVINELVETELFRTYQIVNGKKILTYESEGYDKEKIEAEGSVWIVYVMDCMSNYYQKHKKRINKEAKRIILASA